MRVRIKAFCPSSVPYSTSSARPRTNAVVMPTLFGTARVQNETSSASHMGRNTSMNWGMGDTLSSRPMANVSQTTQPLLRRETAIIVSAVGLAQRALRLGWQARRQAARQVPSTQALQREPGHWPAR
ncbi:hypothetical protein D3C79_748140 [compost metagenome]